MKNQMLLSVLAFVAFGYGIVQAQDDQFWWLKVPNSESVLGKIAIDLKTGNVFVTCKGEKLSYSANDVKRARQKCPLSEPRLIAASIKAIEGGRVVVQGIVRVGEGVSLAERGGEIVGWYRVPPAVSGAISDINLTADTFMVGDRAFSAAPGNTVGTKLSDLKEGDKVTVTFAHIGDTSGKSSINALTLTKEE
jgi:hypothetical protein